MKPCAWMFCGVDARRLYVPRPRDCLLLIFCLLQPHSAFRTLVEARALALASQWALIGTEATMLSPERGAPPTEPSQPQVAGMASCGELWRSEARGRREGAKRGRCARAAGAVLPALPGARLRREGGHECAHLARQGEVCCHA
eukprot:scaffold76056_cov70-Phaeocystis_antarctica.AAC.6